jgi:hypothetical protein
VFLDDFLEFLEHALLVVDALVTDTEVCAETPWIGRVTPALEIAPHCEHCRVVTPVAGQGDHRVAIAARCALEKQVRREKAHEFEHCPQRLRNRVAERRWIGPDTGPVVFGCHSADLATVVHAAILRFGNATLGQGEYVLNVYFVSVIVNWWL